MSDNNQNNSFIKCSKCNCDLIIKTKQFLDYIDPPGITDVYVQSKNYYLQIHNKNLNDKFEDDEPIQVTDFEEYVCEDCHYPVILKAKQRLNESN